MSPNKEEMISSQSSPMTLFVLKATAIASLGGVLFGYDMGVIASALPQISEDFMLSEKQQELVVGILYLGGGLGASIGGFLCDTMGRKTSIMITDIMFVIGAIIMFFSTNFYQLLIGRVVVGFAIAVSGIADVAYLHEIAPQNWRGSIVSVNESCISLGFLLAFAFGVFWESVDGGWRYMLGISGWLAAVQFIGMLAMPESPIWLGKHGREEDREKALQKMHGDFCSTEGHNYSVSPSNRQCSNEGRIAGIPTSDTYFVARNKIYDEELFPTDTKQNHGKHDLPDENNLHFLQLAKQYRFQCVIAVFLSVSQQICGQAAVLNYAPHIFSSLQGRGGLSVTLWIGVVKFVVTTLVIGLIEYFGRRFLLIFGMLTIAISQFLLAFAFSISTDLGGDTQQASAICGFIGIMGVVIGYSASFGPLTWLITSELFPSDIRGRALGTATIVNYICASLVTSSFLSMEILIGPHIIFLTYGFTTLLATVIADVAILDTGRKSAEDIDKLLKQMWFWRLFQHDDLLVNSSNSQDVPPVDVSGASSSVYAAF
mmetsp:Transcript_18961/g.28093  ORF Transcript_18961/g.28093 Transcript_18961/m.28093 type:complete len:543 (-) Transcript_18961:4614-6242(-)